MQFWRIVVFWVGPASQKRRKKSFESTKEMSLDGGEEILLLNERNVGQILFFSLCMYVGNGNNRAELLFPGPFSLFFPFLFKSPFGLMFLSYYIQTNPGGNVKPGLIKFPSGHNTFPPPSFPFDLSQWGKN